MRAANFELLSYDGPPSPRRPRRKSVGVSRLVPTGCPIRDKTPPTKVGGSGHALCLGVRVTVPTDFRRGLRRSPSSPTTCTCAQRRARRPVVPANVSRFAVPQSTAVLFYLGILISTAPAVSGCGSSNVAPSKPVSESAGSDATTVTSADDVLKKMIDAYQHATSYRDNGQVRISYRQAGELHEDQADLIVKLERPNKLSLRAYQVTLACDGKTLHAKIRDEQTGDIDGQVVVRPAPAVITLPELHTDEILRDAISSGLGRHPAQLELLLSEKPLETVFDEQVERNLLSPESIDNHPCQRVEVKTVEGSFVFWVDQHDYLLRRLEFPTNELAQQIGQAGPVSDVQLAADFTDARFGDKLNDEEFRFEIPADAKQVRAFVLPPQPLPSKLFGKRPAGFSFASLDGSLVSRDSLKGKIAVLVWFNDHPASRTSLEQLNQVRDTVRNDARVQFVAVCTEPSSVSNLQLRQLVDGWKVGVPVARDLDAYGRDVFQIPFAPTLVVLDAQGVLHIFEVGANPNLAEQLPVVLGRLLAGENLAAELLAHYENDLATYHRALAAVGASGEPGSDQTTVIELPETKIPPRSDPRHLKLSKLWTCSELKAPGNILVISTPQQEQRIIVHDGWRTVAELDEQGKVVASHELDLPDKAAVSYLCTVTTNDGRRYFAASAVRSQQVHLFDENWQRLLSYPPAEQDHDGIMDVQLSNLDDDGKPELYVGYWSLLGVHSVTPDGRRLWSNRIVPTVLSLAVAPNDGASRKLLVTSDRGSIVPLNEFGKHDPEINVNGRAIHQLFAAQFGGDRPTAYCGISYNEDGGLVAVGLNRDLVEQWSYNLPLGVFRTQIQFVTSGSFLDRPGGQWLLAGPNGSIHIISDDGDFVDAFHYGEELTGLAAARFGNDRVLLIAAGKTITVWRIE